MTVASEAIAEEVGTMVLSRSAACSGSVVTRWILATAVGFGGGVAVGWGIALVVAMNGANPDPLLAVAGLLCVGVVAGVAQSRVLLPYVPGAWRWIVATSTGHVLALLVVMLAGSTRLPDPALFALLGAAVGCAQWWVLRWRFRCAALWIAASAAGFMGFVWLVAHPASVFVELVVVSAMLGGAGAIVPGVALAWLTRQQHQTMA